MNKKLLLLTGLILLVAVSCKDYLEPYPNGIRTEEDIWKYQENVQGLIGRCYDYMSINYDNNEGAYLDGATDDAEITSSTSVLRKLATGSITTGQDPFLTYWNRDYQGIYLTNLFLKDRRGYKTRFLLDPHLNDILRTRLQGEAFALRAWFQWDLLQKFGGKGINGQMLGFPIITEPVDPSGEINFERNTYEECVQQIIADCDSAYKYLPVAHRDFLVQDDGDLLYSGGKYWGRMDGIITRAIKANVYLTWASPLFNPSDDVARWDSAAANAKKVIDFKLNVDNVADGFSPTARVNWFNPMFPGIVFGSRWTTSTSAMEAMEKMFYPGGFQGNGAMGATQDLVDAFPMANGYPIDDPRSNYDPADPYANRDPRFYSTIFYNTAQSKRNNTGSVMYTFENWAGEGGKDAAGISSSNSLTNYHIKKFVNPQLNWSDSKPNRQPHSKFFIRWAHMCLVFAEAANHVAGPTDESTYGMSAQTAIQYMRGRRTYDNAIGISPTVGGAPDAYLAEIAAAGEDAFDALVKNERRIETCFEGLRFFDIRRWTTDISGLNQSIHGAGIVKNADNTYTYDLNKEVGQRTYSSAYLPIPYAEILRMSKLVQNEGWDGWN